MGAKAKLFNAVKYIGSFLLVVGSIVFSFGFFGSGSGVLTAIGIGTVMGAVFIFLMGVFFVITEELLGKIDHREKMTNW